MNKMKHINTETNKLKNDYLLNELDMIYNFKEVQDNEINEFYYNTNKQDTNVSDEEVNEIKKVNKDERNYLGQSNNLLIKNFNLKKLSKQTLKELIGISIRTEKYEDSIICCKTLIINYPKILFSERHFIEDPIKNIIQYKQSNLRKLLKLESQIKSSNDQNLNTNQALLLVINNKEKISGQIISICNDFLELISNNLLTNITSKNMEAIFYRLKADLNKYLSQLTTELKNEYISKTEFYYKESIKISEELTYDSKEDDQEAFIPSKKILKNKIYLKSISSLCNFYLNYCNEPSKASFLIEEIVKSVELQYFFKDGSLFADEELNEILHEIGKLFNDSQSKKLEN